MNNAIVPGSCNIIGESAKNRTLLKEQKITLRFNVLYILDYSKKLAVGLSSVAREGEAMACRPKRRIRKISRF